MNGKCYPNPCRNEAGGTQPLPPSQVEPPAFVALLMMPLHPKLFHKSVISMHFTATLGNALRASEDSLTWIRNRRIVLLAEDENDLVVTLSDRASDTEAEAAIVTINNVAAWSTTARKFLEGA